MSEIEMYHIPFEQQRELQELPPSAKFIIFLLKTKGSMNRKKIIEETLMPDRTVGFALRLLLQKRLIKKEDPNDMNLFGVKHKRHRKDKRIINYNLVSTMLSYGMAEA
ncbi:MAG TPA: hypothetical protein VMV49_00965 [Candidatus Deferrimicrobium sp.]|nr:hypothetical protein [Candidatus Deferrimicrobium sp.]